MFMFKLALRNLFRSFKRTLLSVTTVVVGTMALVFAYGMILGVEDTLINVDISTNSGHMRVFRKGYLKEEENFPLNITVDQPEAVKAALKKQFPKATVFKQVVFSAKVSDGVSGLPVRGIVMPPRATKHFTFLRKDNKLMPGDGNVIMIGDRLAQTFKKKVGDTITVEARTQTGSINALDFKIIHVFSAGNPLIDFSTIFLPEKSGRKFLQMPKDAINVMAFFPRRKDSLKGETIAAGVSAKNFPQTWQEKGKEIQQLQEMRRQMFNFLIAILMMVAAAGLANTVLMSGYERKGEVGMMLAMGFPRGKIVQLFAIEAGMLGFFGGLVGAILGSAFTLYFQFNGLDISAKMDAVSSSATAMSSANILYFYLSPSIVVIAILIGVFVAVAAAIWPAFRITEMEPREILAGS